MPTPMLRKGCRRQASSVEITGGDLSNCVNNLVSKWYLTLFCCCTFHAPDIHHATTTLVDIPISSKFSSTLHSDHIPLLSSLAFRLARECTAFWGLCDIQPCRGVFDGAAFGELAT